MPSTYLPINWPLSGNVTQTLFPTYWTVNVGQSSNPTLEQDLLSVASYGKQLGRIEDALNVLLLRCLSDRKALSDDERRAVTDFSVMLYEINKMKKQHAVEHLIWPQLE